MVGTDLAPLKPLLQDPSVFHNVSRGQKTVTCVCLLLVSFLVLLGSMHCTKVEGQRMMADEPAIAMPLQSMHPARLWQQIVQPSQTAQKKDAMHLQSLHPASLWQHIVQVTPSETKQRKDAMHLQWLWQQIVPVTPSQTIQRKDALHLKSLHPARWWQQIVPVRASQTIQRKDEKRSRRGMVKRSQIIQRKDRQGKDGLRRGLQRARANSRVATIVSPRDVQSARPNSREATTASLRDLAFEFGAANLPHPNKMFTGGDDVFFIDRGNRALGISDGASWWKTQGVDPSKFPKELIRRVQDLIKDKDSKIKSLKNVLARAHEATKATGSATVCLAQFSPESSAMRVYNLGDSGLWVLRSRGGRTDAPGQQSWGWRVVWKAPKQSVQFNMPYQLSSEWDLSKKAADGASQEIKLEPGDLILAATDGLWDNLHMDEVVKIVDEIAQGRGPKGLSPDKAAKTLAWAARTHSVDPNYRSPRGTGGKPDDITVVAALAVPHN
eukprot:gnl/MRDRNA2_/MRDRNA2_34696_c0_seq1.p1 gnl/MRDRNA2_/MRDRNA2_34696_c0~~gnl/MRDRNA2_/MRDRNA2_34696_c0_seq1.p1  ORF type:complete len:496 (-),score=95.67 gnl/MRDRNA2_/MRDRNA2_34696_c0_seq1:51-1538(-)